MGPQDVTGYWRGLGQAGWFGKSDAVDAEIRGRFEAAHHAAARRELDGWAATAEGALALLLLLDQFPRNLYRGTAHSYATDSLARALAEDAIAHGFDRAIEPALRSFFYLPFEHSEALADQERCLALCQAAGDADSIKWALIHLDIVRRFGRFPHRNRALGRTTTAEEQAFLDSGGFSG